MALCADEFRRPRGSAGAESPGDAIDDGGMYMRGFRDLDGHQWSFVYMDFEG